MGLLKAGAGALGGVLADQWKEFFYCESLDSDTLVAKGEKRVGKRSSNTKGTDNVISNGSVISVNEGQSMIIVESGKVVEFCAEPGEFVYDSSTEPSIFCGSLGESIKKSFAEVGKRFTFGGDAAKDQRVYYFNTKEITGNKFGTPAPVPFRVTLDESMNYKLSVDLRCNGVYSYKIADPLLFYTNVSGNVEYTYDRSELDEMLKSELLDALRPAFAKVSAMKIMYSEIPAHTKEVTSALAGELSSEWREKRGIELYAVSINGVSIPDDQRKKITEWEENLMTMNPNMAASRIVGSQADAMRTAAGNPNGAAAGFFGMGMAGNAGGANAANLFAMGANTENSAPKTGWTCSCGAVNTGKFCSECGKPQPSGGWTCECGTANTGKFCSNCGKPNPGAVPKYKCNKCGWVPEDPENPPKFCPECGDAFDGNDRA
jgi:membrane protease subunit (stomatin/prohibitin family)